MNLRFRLPAAIGLAALFAALGWGVPSARANEAASLGDVAPRTVYLTVEDAWRLAETHHPKVRAAQRELEARERELAQRQASFSPTLTLRVIGPGLRLETGEEQAVSVSPSVGVNGGWKLPAGASVNANVSARSGTGASGSQEVSGTVTLSVPLRRTAALDPDALAVRQAEGAVEAARRRLVLAQQEARAEVLAALQALEAAAARLRLAEEALAAAQTARRVVDERLAAGAANRAEELEADLELLRAEQELAVARRSFEARRGQLLKLLGLSSVDGVEYEFESVWTWTGMPAVAWDGDMVARAIEYSVAVFESRQAVDNARLELASQRERSGWEASINAGYATQGQQDAQPGWSVTLQFSYPLADGGQRRLALEGREAAFAAAQEALATAVAQVQEEMEELMFQLEDARRQVEMAALERQRAELEWTVAQRRMELPVPAATPEAVASAWRTLQRADIAWREAVWAYQSQWINLQIRLGGVDWDALKAGGE